MIQKFRNGTKLQLLGVCLILWATTGFGFIVKHHDHKLTRLRGMYQRSLSEIENLNTAYQLLQYQRDRVVDHKFFINTFGDKNSKTLQPKTKQLTDYFQILLTHYRINLTSLGCIVQGYSTERDNPDFCLHFSKRLSRIKDFKDLRLIDHEYTKKHKELLARLNLDGKKLRKKINHIFLKKHNTYNRFLFFQMLGIFFVPLGIILNNKTDTSQSAKKVKNKDDS